MNEKRLLALLALTATLGWTLPALADDPPLSDAQELERADQLFKDGNTAFDANEFAKARELYLQAFAIKKTYDIAAHLGLSEMELGLYRDAAEHLAASIRAAPPHQSKKKFERVIAELEKAKKEVATVFVTAPAGAKLFIDGREVGTAPVAHEIFVETGRRNIEARLGNRVGAEQPELTKGSTTKIAITVPAATGDTGPDPEPTKRPSWPGWVMGGVGLVSAGVGAALLGVGQKNIGDAEDIGADIESQGGSCKPAAGPGSSQCDELVDSLDSGDALSNSGIALLSVGGALLIGGVVYLAIPDSEEPAAKASVSFSPWISAEGGGFILGGGF